MSYLAAGVVSVLVLAVAALSWSYAPFYQARVEAAGGASADAAPAATAFSLLTSLRKGELLAFVFLAALCGLAVEATSHGAAGLALAQRSVVLILLVSAALFDRRTHLIPNFLVFAMLVFGALILGGEFLLDRTAFAAAIIPAVVGVLVCFPIFYMLSALTHNGLGMGDVKLISAMAWNLGLTVTLFSVLFGLILCALTAICLMLTKKKRKTDLLPLAPFLLGGYLLLLVLFSI